VRQLLAGEADVEVAGECRSGAEALAAIRAGAPDLVFFDIQMPEMDGFEVLAELDPARLPALVFVTAYDQYALKAFDFHAVDYLLKPFDGRRFREALARARERLAARDTADVGRRVLALLSDVQQRRRYLQRFAVRSAGRVVLVPARDVEAIEADGNYMQLHCASGQSHTIRETMDELVGSLDPQRFIRVHRSWVVNVDQIQELQSWFHGAHVLVLRHGRHVPVGRKYSEVIAGLLRNNP
jgi:two-component system, LytTR family, response regulator